MKERTNESRKWTEGRKVSAEEIKKSHFERTNEQTKERRIVDKERV